MTLEQASESELTTAARPKSATCVSSLRRRVYRGTSLIRNSPFL